MCEPEIEYCNNIVLHYLVEFTHKNVYYYFYFKIPFALFGYFPKVL